jgi:hypothetical protein
MYWQSFGLEPRFWSARMRGFFITEGQGETKMSEQESAAVRNANRHFRKEEQAKAGAAAWKEYLDLEDATRVKTARLRAERLARVAATAVTLVPAPKQARNKVRISKP